MQLLGQTREGTSGLEICEATFERGELFACVLNGFEPAIGPGAFKVGEMVAETVYLGLERIEGLGDGTQGPEMAGKRERVLAPVAAALVFGSARGVHPPGLGGEGFAATIAALGDMGGCLIGSRGLHRGGYYTGVPCHKSPAIDLQGQRRMVRWCRHTFARGVDVLHRYDARCQ